MRKLTNTFAFALAATFALSSCNNANKTEGEKSNLSDMEKNLPEYKASTNIENPSVYLRLVDKTMTDSSAVFIAKALDGKDTIGLSIEVIDGMHGGVLEDGTANEERGFREGGIKIKSIGAVSDNFVKSLADLYDLKEDAKMTSETLLPLVFSSNKKNVDLNSNDTYTFKVFLDNAMGKEAEAFITLDLYSRRFEMRGRDATEYVRIISAFTGK